MSKRFRIAFSFAGEKRKFVAEVAGILAKRFGKDRILYDKYHTPEFSRSDLAFYLPDLYEKDADLVVAVFCLDYDKKEWCGLEWNAIYGLLKSRNVEEVMLTRFERVEGKGLHGLAGYTDLDDLTPEQSATLILERLAFNEGLPHDYYTRDSPAGPEWPPVAPPLDWPVADHREAQSAFAQLITRAAPFRLLPIHGASGTGKSHLTKQFLRNALKIPDLTCGRFDFKGSSDMEKELLLFAERLEAPTPTPCTGVSGQLAQIFATVKKAARPTLLIFDTFELAGEAERWVKENLLIAIIKASWLRVIIVGQQVIGKQGEPWTDVSFQPINLLPPTPEEWFDYGKSRNSSPDFTIEFIRSVHACVNGKSSVIAQVCGGPAA